MKFVTYWGRGIKYAFTSICAIYAGYLMQTKNPISFDLLVLTIPALASFFYFICYAQRFELEYLETSQDERVSERKTTAIVVGAMVVLLLMLIVSLVTQTLSGRIIVAFSIQAAMYAAYSYFLLKHLPLESNRVVRHQLFWSVILSIGISLYYGFAFPQLSISLFPLVPVAVIAALFVFDQLTQFKKKAFAIGTLIIFCFSATLVILTKMNIISMPFGLGDSFYTLMFCLTISAYLAVFEAWKVTSDIAKGRRFFVTIHNPAGIANLKQRYSIATLLAITLAIWFSPLFFIFSQYGEIFLIGFGLHAIVAFLIWYIFGQGKYLKSWHWGWLKAVLGTGFLILLVIASYFDTPPSGHIYKELVSMTAIFGFGGCTVYVILKFVDSYYLRPRKASKKLITRINFVRFLCIMSFGMFVVINVILQRYEDKQTEYYKGEMALGFYAICIIMCSIIELFHKSRFSYRPRKTMVLNHLIGFIILSRIVTSLLITLAVLLPSIYTGIGFWNSILSALPFFLSAIGGFALNDYCDADKDKINKPYRAIPSGKLTPNSVLIFSIISIILSSISAFFISDSLIKFVLYIICILGVTSYNLFVKHLSLWKTFLTSVVSSLPILFSVIVYSYPKIYLLLPVATCSFILGREWLMDIRDIRGDLKGRIVTIPMWLGSAMTAKFGFGFQFLAAVLLLPIVIYNWSFWSFSLLAMITLSVIILAPLWSYRVGLFRQRIIQLLWVPMLFGLLLFIK